MYKHETVRDLIRDVIEPFEARTMAQWAGCSQSTVSRAIGRHCQGKLRFVWQCRRGYFYRLYFTRDWQRWEISDYLRSRNKTGKTQARIHVL